MTNIFSKIVKGEIPCYKIYENNDFLAFLDAFPIKEGHTLVIPKQEIDNFFDLSIPSLQGIITFAQPIAKAIERAFNCPKCGMSVVGLEIPHAHMHLVPLHTIGDMNFKNPKLKFSPEKMRAIQEKIKQYLIN